MNRCQGCDGKGYAGALRPMPTPCAVCEGTGRGHVHRWEWRGYLCIRGTAVRRCQICRETQGSGAYNHMVATVKGYEAAADVNWGPLSQEEQTEADALVFHGRWKP